MNEKLVKKGQSEAFSHEVDLELDENTLKIAAVDRYDRRTEKAVRVTRLERPALSLRWGDPTSWSGPMCVSPGVRQTWSLWILNNGREVVSSVELNISWPSDWSASENASQTLRDLKPGECREVQAKVTPNGSGEYELRATVSTEGASAVEDRFSVTVNDPPRPTPPPTRPAQTSGARFSKAANGVITDSQTGLQWYVGKNRINHYDAEKWARSLSVDGGGWRLPTRAELKGIYQKGVGKKYHNIDPVFEISSDYLYVWSSEIRNSSSAWRFNFDGGRADSRPRDGALASPWVFAARSGRR